MKKVFLGAFFVLLPSLAQAADVAAVSKISKVVVYQDRALVTRQAQVELAAGPNSVLFEGLPGSLLEDSLRADGKSTGSVSLEGVEVKKEFVAGEADPRAAVITAELEKFNDEMAVLNARQQNLADQKAFLDSIRNFSAQQLGKDIQTKSLTGTEITGLSESLLAQYDANKAKEKEVEVAVRGKYKEIEAKQRELNELQGGQSTDKKTAVVNLDAKSKTTFNIELTYVVPQATWNISYDAKVQPDQKNVTLITYGNPRQWTGEDWKDVSLTLSSAKPAVGGRMPELSPWYVDFFHPRPQAAAYRSEVSMKRKAMADEADASGGMMLATEAMAPPMEQKAELAKAAVSQEMGSITYEVAKASTILSDGRSYKVPVTTESFKTELDFEATPKISPYAYIHSKVANDKDHSLPTGEVNVFVNDNFIGKSWIQTVGTGETFDLYLGIDEEVKVKRTELKEKQKKALLGLRARRDFAYKIEIESYKKTPVKISVIDQLPVSQNADIKAELVSSSVKPVEDPNKPKELGILKWSFDVAPKEKKSVEFAFFIEYPSDKTVTGI